MSNTKLFQITYNDIPVSIHWRSISINKEEFYPHCRKLGINTLKDFCLYIKELGLCYSIKQNKSVVRGKTIYFIDCEVYDKCNSL